MEGDLEVGRRSREVLVTLFPFRELTTYALGKEMELDPSAARTRARKLLDSPGLVRVEERQEDNVKKFYYSLTERGRELTQGVVEEEIVEKRYHLTDMEEKLAIYFERLTDDS